MGLNKQQFNTDVFLKLPWKTTNLNRNISKIFSSKNNHIHYLEILTDIDNGSDIELILNNFKSISTKIKSVLLLFISSTNKTVAYLKVTFQNFILNKLRNKGSPIALNF